MSARCTSWKVIWLCTPLRNGLTLGAKDGETFDRGILEESDHGWRTKNPALLVSTERLADSETVPCQDARFPPIPTTLIVRALPRFSVAVCTLVGQADAERILEYKSQFLQQWWCNNLKGNRGKRSETLWNITRFMMQNDANASSPAPEQGCSCYHRSICQCYKSWIRGPSYHSGKMCQNVERQAKTDWLGGKLMVNKENIDPSARCLQQVDLHQQ